MSARLDGRTPRSAPTWLATIGGLLVHVHHIHGWTVTVAEAVTIQQRLAPLVRHEALGTVETMAGVDVDMRGNRLQAAAVVLRLPGLREVDHATWQGDVIFPYIPGLLSFREAPAILEALARLTSWPDLIMVDAHGLAHPRRFGLASHLGVLLDMPTLGVAKSLLVGTHDELGAERGSHVPLQDGNEVIGAAVRTRSNAKPVYVSVGHRLILADAIAVTLATATRYRQPEPIRRAHLLSKRV